MKMMQTAGLVAAAIAGVLAGSTADAAILQYSFDAGSYYNFSGGSDNAVTGTFDYDTADGSFSNVNYNRGGTIFTVASSTGPGAQPNQAFFGDTNSGDYDVYQFANSLAAGGTDVITAAYHPSIVVDGGGSVSVAGADAVPEPATWALMLTGFGLAGALTRRQRKVALAG